MKVYVVSHVIDHGHDNWTEAVFLHEDAAKAFCAEKNHVLGIDVESISRNRPSEYFEYEEFEVLGSNA